MAANAQPFSLSFSKKPDYNTLVPVIMFNPKSIDMKNFLKVLIVSTLCFLVIDKIYATDIGMVEHAQHQSAFEPASLDQGFVPSIVEMPVMIAMVPEILCIR